MRFLADENIPASAVAALPTAGYDVVSLRETAPGMADAEIVNWAVHEERILLTFDKDFGELAARNLLPNSCGIVLFRVPMIAQQSIGQQVASRLKERDEWAGHFSVIEPNRIRMRPLRRTES